MMKTTRRIIPLLLLVGSLTAGAEGLRKEGGEAFLEPLQKRDSVLVADQFRYGIELKDVAEGTPLALPEIQTEKDSPLEFVGDWQLDSVKVKKTGLYTIKASRLLTAWWGGSYELPDIPVLFGSDTLVFKAPTEPLVVNELPIDMENFQAHDIKDQVKFHSGTRIDPFFVYSVMRQESIFNFEIASPVGARGLLQIMPATGKMVAAKEGIPDFDPLLLFNPYMNIRLGVRYLVDLKAEYSDDYMYVLGNYNAGPKPTKRWQAAGQGKHWDIRAEEISYWETRDYVKRVMGNYWIYQEIVYSFELHYFVFLGNMSYLN